jgi:hypothetical protein
MFGARPPPKPIPTHTEIQSTLLAVIAYAHLFPMELIFHEFIRKPIDGYASAGLACRIMTDSNLDELRSAYKRAVDAWVDSIRAEEALATPDHSMVAMEKWDDARFREEDAQKDAKDAAEAYKGALRSVNYGI